MHNYIIEFLCFLLPHFPPTSVCIFSLKSASKSLDEHLLTEKCYCEIARKKIVDESTLRRSTKRAYKLLKKVFYVTDIQKLILKALSLNDTLNTIVKNRHQKNVSYTNIHL